METIVIHLFCWSGLFAGYLVEDFLFDVNGVYLGWEDASGRLWRRDGSYLGERVDQHYVMRRDGFATPVPLPRRVPPVIPDLPAPPANRAARPPRPGWTDALAAIVSRPGTDDLIGVWHNPNDRMSERRRYLPARLRQPTAAGRNLDTARQPDPHARIDGSRSRPIWSSMSSIRRHDLESPLCQHQ